MNIIRANLQICFEFGPGWPPKDEAGRGQEEEHELRDAGETRSVTREAASSSPWSRDNIQALLESAAKKQSAADGGAGSSDDEADAAQKPAAKKSKIEKLFSRQNQV